MNKTFSEFSVEAPLWQPGQCTHRMLVSQKSFAVFKDHAHHTIRPYTSLLSSLLTSMAMPLSFDRTWLLLLAMPFDGTNDVSVTVHFGRFQPGRPR